jgi:predicted nucleic acid-binding protein
MDKVLVDTNIVSYLMKQHTTATRYFKHIENRIVCVAFVTIGELYLWAETRNWGEAKRSQLEERLRSYVVLPYDKLVAQCYARTLAALRKAGKRIDWPDAWIAATAIAFDLPLVTHNGRHFADIDTLKVVTEPE